MQPDEPSAPRILSRDDAEALAKRIFAMAQGGGETRVFLSSWWQGEVRWARNRVAVASDRRDISLTIKRFINGSTGVVDTNQTDDASLQRAVRAAEQQVAFGARRVDPPSPFQPPIPQLGGPKMAIWSDATYDLTTELRGAVARAVVGPAEANGLLSAGYLEMRGGSRMEIGSRRPSGPYAPWDMPFTQWTQAQCSLTVRDQQGAGSGWAGLSSYDWRSIDPQALGARALEKCLASRNPVTLEPGRYTVILEPQAVADLMERLVRSLDREQPEGDGSGPWALAFDDALSLWRTKLGLKVVDERITISHDPTDPQLGIVPDPNFVSGTSPVTWIDRGTLTTLAHDRAYALIELDYNEGMRKAVGYRMSGGDTTVDEMIRTTKRGLLVTRLSNIRGLDDTSLLATGLTRDGLWLIENGKISKAVKNLRFTESPLFVLNSLEQLGPPERVFRPTDTGGELTPAIVPPLKARDFSFTSTIDAI